MTDLSKRLSLLEEAAQLSPVERGELMDFGLWIHRVYGDPYEKDFVVLSADFLAAVELVYGEGDD